MRKGMGPMKWYPHSCPACGGDLHEDAEDRRWVECLMCARSYPFAEVIGVRSERVEAPTPTGVSTAALVRGEARPELQEAA